MTDTLANRLQPKHFSLIKAVAETGQLSLAAHALSITQPAASRMLADVERLVGAPVFIRTPKGMEPTAVGRALARRAHGLLEEFREAAREVDAIKRGLIGSVRVGAVTGGALGYIVPAIRALKAEARTADIHVDVAPSGSLISDLRSGQLDFILGRIPVGTDARQFDVRHARVEEVDLLVHQSHPLAFASKLEMNDLVHFSWVMQGPGAPVRQAVESVFIEAGAAIPSDIVNTTSLLVMIAMLATSYAIAPMSSEVSDLLCRHTTGSGLCRLDIRTPIIVAPYHLITLKGKRSTPVAERLCDLVLHEFMTRRLD
ncbi:LysR family transcriptional regulator [Agrobacterium sp. a22-2]|uniref:LysR family transcriptional regulator n=1 Tax=Agrobacterium sp. a22-2 TaxID=2283840 RepID=UPI0014483E35|nr:LysR family transcriptional regulator [Agrobacterium sp. a22-2]NKN38279.1 LysR family transcriptional regulator [Agrobacterium sp. a22-2]